MSEKTELESTQFILLDATSGPALTRFPDRAGIYVKLTFIGHVTLGDLVDELNQYTDEQRFIICPISKDEKP